MKRTLLYAAMVFFAGLHSAGATEAAAPPLVSFTDEPASADARYAARWIASHADNQRMPFAIVDKKNARMFVFEPDGRLRAATAVLLGAGPGDASVPGIAGRDPASLLPQERTTPAGRFLSEPGHNLKGEDIVWVDYDTKIAIHRLVPTLPARSGPYGWHQRRRTTSACRLAASWCRSVFTTASSGRRWAIALA